MVVNLRRAFVGAVGVALACLAWTQSSAPEIPRAPDAVIVVSKHPIGADIFRIRMLKPGYSADVLRNQVAAFGQLMGSAPRGLEVSGVKLSSKDVEPTATAYFALDGFANVPSGTFRLEPLVRAFVQVPANPPVTVLDVMVQDAAVTPRTLTKWETSAVKVDAQDMGPGVGVEFRVVVKATKAEDIVIPEDGTSVPKATASPQPKEKSGPNPVVWVVLLLGLAAGGGLVYLGVSGNRKSPRSN